MSQKWSIWILLLVVLIPFSLALNENVAPQENISVTTVTLCSSLLNDYNLIGMQIPSFIPFTHNTFNVFVNSTPTAHVELKDKKITAFDCDVVEHPDYELFISNNSVIQDILDSDHPMQVYKKFKKNDAIKFRGTSFGRTIKVGFLHTVLAIVGLFN